MQEDRLVWKASDVQIRCLPPSLTSGVYCSLWQPSLFTSNFFKWCALSGPSLCPISEVCIIFVVTLAWILLTCNGAWHPKGIPVVLASVRPRHKRKSHLHTKWASAKQCDNLGWEHVLTSSVDNFLLCFCLPIPGMQRLSQQTLLLWEGTVSVPCRALQCLLPPHNMQPVTQGVPALPLSGDIGPGLGTSLREFPVRQCSWWHCH